MKPRKLRTEPNCRGKWRYSDETCARAAGMVSLTEHPGRRKLFVYLCPHCCGWHLTKSYKDRRSMVTVLA